MYLHRLQAGRSEMNTTSIVLIIAVLIVIGLISMVVARRERTKKLEEHFGPEYERTISVVGDQSQAEKELEERIAHKKSLNIRPLSAEEVNRYALEWQDIQRDFVDEPLTALQKGDRLIQEVMRLKGYPVEDFEERAALISVDYPQLVKDYRGMHRIAVKEVNDQVSTEDMRQAMVHARALFESLIRQEPEDINQKEKI
jgi:hypothetical protein